MTTSVVNISYFMNQPMHCVIPNSLFFAVVLRGPVDPTKTLRWFESCRSVEDGTRCEKENVAYIFGHVCKLIFGQAQKQICTEA